MSGIKLGRVLGGGVLAGAVLNLFEMLVNGVLLGQDWQNIARRSTVPEMETGPALLLWVIITFLLGITLVWVYAAIRPRFGAGPKTAIIAGLLLWFIVSVLRFFSYYPFFHYPFRMCVIIMSVGLLEYLFAALAGAWLYRED